MSEEVTERIAESRPRVTPVLPSWFEAYSRGNTQIPQTHFGTSIMVGETVVRSISQGESTWRAFAKSQLTQEQLDQLHQTASRLHAIYRIGESYEYRGVGEEALNNLWEGTCDTVLRAANVIAKWATCEEGQFESDNEITHRLNKLFSKKQYQEKVAILMRLYSATSAALGSEDGQKFAKLLRDSLKPDQAENLPHKEREGQLLALRGLVADSLREEAQKIKGETQIAIPEAVIDTFVKVNYSFGLAGQRKRGSYF